MTATADPLRSFLRRAAAPNTPGILMTWHTDSRGRTVPYVLQQRCFKRDRWTCIDCGYTGSRHAGDLNADHDIPSAEGGPTTLDNLVTRCVPCHGRKTQQEAARGRRRRSGKRRPPVHPSDALLTHPTDTAAAIHGRPDGPPTRGWPTSKPRGNHPRANPAAHRHRPPGGSPPSNDFRSVGTHSGAVSLYAPGSFRVQR